MHIVVEDKTVRENLYCFITQLSKAEAKREKMGATWMEGVYRVYLHRQTGHLYFAAVYRELFDPSEYKMLDLDYSYNPDTASLEAMVYESEGKGRAFQLEGLSITAIHAIKETIHVINRVSSLVKGNSSSLITKIQDICTLQIDEKKDRNVLTSAWHNVDRLEAEKLLLANPVGTFLLREDAFAKLLSERLSAELDKIVKCITLSVLEPENQVCEYTLVHVDHQWRCYDNVLFCNVQGFGELSNLIQECFGERARFVLAPAKTEKQRRSA